MTNYDNISKHYGELHWQNSITHDNGQFAQDGGGKSTLLLGQPGKGKSTLLCQMAQMSRCIHTGSKIPFVKDLLAREPLDQYSGKIFQETVIWRARDMDSFANIIPQNWITSFKGTMGSAKDMTLWVHERDAHVIFFSYNHKRQEIPVQNLPPPLVYRDAEDLIRRLKWGAINVVLEPQTYTLSPTLIQKLREKKMDISEEEDRDRERKKLLKDKPSHIRKSTRNVITDYERREVSPSYFWFDLIHVAKTQNKDRHIMFSLDEVDDIFEARSEGDVWKLIEMLANDWKDLRKHNISTNLSTHEIDFIDWRILPRIDYIIWMTGARVYARSALYKYQPLVSNLPIGLFLVEQRGISYGKNTFEKIPLSQPAVRIDGLKGEDRILTEAVAKKVLKGYEDMWSEAYSNEIIDLDKLEMKPVVTSPTELPKVDEVIEV